MNYKSVEETCRDLIQGTLRLSGGFKNHEELQL